MLPRKRILDHTASFMVDPLVDPVENRLVCPIRITLGGDILRTDEISGSTTASRNNLYCATSDSGNWLRRRSSLPTSDGATSPVSIQTSVTCSEFRIRSAFSPSQSHERSHARRTLHPLWQNQRPRSQQIRTFGIRKYRHDLHNPRP